MAPRTLTGTQQQWDRVASAVVARRNELKLTGADLAAEGISTSVLSLIENAKQVRYSLRTIADLCRGLNWTPDSVQRILDDDEPVSVEDEYLDFGRTLKAALAEEKARGRRPAARDSVAIQMIYGLELRHRNHEERLTAIERRLGIVPDAVTTAWAGDDEQFALAADTGDERGEAGPRQNRPSPPPEPEGP